MDTVAWERQQLNPYLMERMMAANPDIFGGKSVDQVATEIFTPAPAPEPAPSIVQLAAVAPYIKPKSATAGGATGGDGANKQAYGGDVGTLRPVANVGDSGNTMLSGPVGVDPEALLLAKKTLLGA